MNPLKAACLSLATLFVFGSLPMPLAQAGGGSGWGWAKPFNKRMGAFYTSNKNANFSRSKKRSSSHYRRHTNRYHQVYKPSTVYPRVITPVTPQHRQVLPVQPSTVIRSVPSSNVIRQKTIQKTTTPVPENVIPAKPSQSRVNTATPQRNASSAAPLPYRSTTSTFWK